MSQNSTVLHHTNALRGSKKDFVPLLRGEQTGEALAVLRDGVTQIMSGHPIPDGIMVTEVDMGGVPATLVTPDVSEPGRVLFYMHGGGYVSSNPTDYLRGGFHYYPGLSMPDCACGGLHPHLSFFDEGSSVEQEHPGADCTRDRLV